MPGSSRFNRGLGSPMLNSDTSEIPSGFEIRPEEEIYIDEKERMDEESEEMEDANEEDLCASCLLREKHLEAAFKKQEMARQKELEAEDAFELYNRRQMEESMEIERKTFENKKQRELEIQEYNKRMAAQKSRGSDIDTVIGPHRKFKEEGVRNVEDAASAPTGFLMYKRPDTGADNKKKQKQLTHREELARQIAEKKALDQREKEDELQGINRHIQNSQSEMSSTEQKDKRRQQKHTSEYRRALESQIAEKQALDRAQNQSGAWWMKQSETTEKSESLQADQSKRHQKSDAAAKNLEDFVARQKEVDMEASERRRQASTLMQETVPDIALQPEPSPRSVSPRQAARGERQRLVEEAWQKASSETDRKFQVMRQDQGGALLDQLKQYKRCRKCQKAIVRPQDHEHNQKSSIVDPLDEEEHLHFRTQSDVKLKSRYMN